MRIVEAFARKGMGRPPKYPWDEWSDGQIREVDVVEEFGIQPNNFKYLIHRYARLNYCRARFLKVAGNTIQFSIVRRI